jgi:hypothetical protein
MSLYGLTAVRRNDSGFIVGAVNQHADAATNRWLGDAYELDFSNIADMITAGDEMWPNFVLPEGSVHGPRVLARVSAGMKRDICLAERVGDRTFDDLLRIGEGEPATSFSRSNERRI